MNAANEEAGAAFLSGKVGFLDIARIVDETLERMSFKNIRSIDELLSIDYNARRVAQGLVAHFTGKRDA